MGSVEKQTKSLCDPRSFLSVSAPLCLIFQTFCAFREPEEKGKGHDSNEEDS